MNHKNGNKKKLFESSITANLFLTSAENKKFKNFKIIDTWFFFLWTLYLAWCFPSYHWQGQKLFGQQKTISFLLRLWASYKAGMRTKTSAIFPLTHDWNLKFAFGYKDIFIRRKSQKIFVRARTIKGWVKRSDTFVALWRFAW